MIPEKRERKQFIKNITIGITIRGLNPSNWDKLIISRLEVSRYDFGLGYYSDGTSYGDIVGDLYNAQRILELKYAAIKYIHENYHEDYPKVLKPWEIAIISEGEEIYD